MIVTISILPVMLSHLSSLSLSQPITHIRSYDHTGFFFSTTIIFALKLPDGNPTLLSLCSSIGGVLGNIISTFILTKLYTPKFRVILNAIIQIVGILLTWLLSYPMNVIFGLGILTIGFQGMLTTIMPLSNYAGGMATRSYQVGFSAAPVFGIILVEIGTSAGFSASGFFIMALGIPLLNTISFFFLDQTVWTDNDKNKHKKDDGKKKNNTTTAASTADVAIVVINDNSGGSSDSDNNDKRSAVVDDDDDESEGQEQLRPSISLFVDDNLKNSTSNSITVSNMSINDYLTATKEIACRYLPIYVFNFGLARFWTDAVYQPSFVSSSTTYHGLNVEDAITTSDTVLLSSHIGVFGVGLTIFTCLGTIIPQKLSPYWLWIPNVCQAILLSVVLSGVAYGAFPVSFLRFVSCSVLFCFVIRDKRQRVTEMERRVEILDFYEEE